jgi:hypothetical protein
MKISLLETLKIEKIFFKFKKLELEEEVKKGIHMK